jgi:hypothetical protein
MSDAYLPEFGGTYLEDSYFLGVAEGGNLRFKFLFALTDDHPDYATPPAGEAHCHREGTILLARPSIIEWKAAGQTIIKDPDGTYDSAASNSVAQGRGATTSSPSVRRGRRNGATRPSALCSEGLIWLAAGRSGLRGATVSFSLPDRAFEAGAMGWSGWKRARSLPLIEAVGPGGCTRSRRVPHYAVPAARDRIRSPPRSAGSNPCRSSEPRSRPDR